MGYQNSHFVVWKIGKAYLKIYLYRVSSHFHRNWAINGRKIAKKSKKFAVKDRLFEIWQSGCQNGRFLVGQINKACLKTYLYQVPGHFHRNWGDLWTKKCEKSKKSILLIDYSWFFGRGVKMTLFWHHRSIKNIKNLLLVWFQVVYIVIVILSYEKVKKTAKKGTVKNRFLTLWQRGCQDGNFVVW